MHNNDNRRDIVRLAAGGRASDPAARELARMSRGTHHGTTDGSQYITSRTTQKSARPPCAVGLGLLVGLALGPATARAQSVRQERPVRDPIPVADRARELRDGWSDGASPPASPGSTSREEPRVSSRQRPTTTPILSQTSATIMTTATSMTAPRAATPPDPATDPRIDPRVRAFLSELNKDSSPFWELPGPQVRATLTGLQGKTPVDLSGITVTEKDITAGGRSVKLYIVKPQNVRGTPPVILFVHGGVWIAGNFENHKRFVRDLVVGSGAAAVFVEYTPIPDAVYPTQIEESYAAAKWVAEHGADIGVDGRRMAVAGNSVGGDMAAVLTMMARDRGGPKISFQLLFWPATDANFQTGSYQAFETGRFLPRAFMQFGWDIYAPDAKTRKEPYAAPLQASVDQLRGLPPALIQTAENDVLRDEGEAYGRKLSEAGVEVTSTRYNGQIHDFGLLNGLRDVPSTQTALRQASEELARYLKQP
jgi:acetyl esterase